MTITAKIIADSVSKGSRITTMQLRYPRFIHAEFMTHRVFSRNASSSRAIPVSRLIKDVLEDTAMPIHWGKNQPGMQAHEQHDALIWAGGGASYTAQQAWRQARDNAINVARAYAEAGYHKQIVNRLLEPFSHINVVVTATDWANFFELRDHPDAQPEIMLLAQEMKAEMLLSEPVEMKGDFAWHLPYVAEGDMQELADGLQSRDLDELIELACKVSAARCARVSYLTHDGATPRLEADVALFDRLAAGRPLHASPLEHQATPRDGRFANFKGWQSFRNIYERTMS